MYKGYIYLEVCTIPQFPQWFPHLWSEGYYGWEDQMEAIKVASTRENQFHFPGGIAEISATIKDLNNAGMVGPTTSPFYSPNLASAENRGIMENDS